MESNRGGMLSKGIELLERVAEYPQGVTASRLARDKGMPVSTVHRLLSTLFEHGLVKITGAAGEPGRLYTIGLKVFELSQKVATVRDLSEVALPYMRAITEETGEPSLLSIRDGVHQVFVQRVEGWRPIQIRGSVGSRGPLHCTSLGKALVAFLPKDERERLLGSLELQRYTQNTITDYEELLEELDRTAGRGYAVANEEHEEGVLALGLPVLDGRSYPLAAICVAVPSLRVGLEELERFVPLLADAAREIGAQSPISGRLAG